MVFKGKVREVYYALFEDLLTTDKTEIMILMEGNILF